MSDQLLRIETIMDVTKETFLISGPYLGSIEKVNADSFIGKKIIVKDENEEPIEEMTVLEAKKNSSIADVINIFLVLPMHSKSKLQEKFVVYI
jgi:hypothetical protein